MTIAERLQLCDEILSLPNTYTASGDNAHEIAMRVKLDLLWWMQRYQRPLIGEAVV